MSVQTTLTPGSAIHAPNEAAEIPESTRDRVLYFAEQVLRQEEKTSVQNTLKGPSVVKRAKERFEEARGISDITFFKFLAEAAKEPTSKINVSDRRKGYYLAEVVVEGPSQEIEPEAEGDTEHHSSINHQEPLRQSCPMHTRMCTSESRMGMKTQKIVEKLEELGKKYGCGSPTDEYIVESRVQLDCKLADGTIRDITVVLREEYVSVFCRPNPPQWFEGNSRVEDALKEVERLLQNPNKP
jgi:hypothetical protein